MKETLWLLLLLLGSGCVAYRPQTLSSSASAASLTSRRLDAPELREFIAKYAPEKISQWPVKEWDCSLLTLAAFYWHPNMALARAQAESAQAGVLTAGGRLNPTVGVTPGYNFTPNGMPAWIPGATIDWPIETAGKRGHRRERARQAAVAAEQGILTAAWQVRASLRTALIDYAGALERRRLLQQQIGIEERVVQALRQRQEAGAIAQSEITPLNLALARARLEAADASRQLTQARAAIAEAMGLSWEALEDISIRCDFSHHKEPGTKEAARSARQKALTERADIRAGLAEFSAAQAALQLEIARQYPDIHLGTGYQWDQGESKWQLGLTAEIPVLNRNEGPIAEAEARRNEVRARFIATQARALGEVDRAMASLGIAAAQARDTEALLELQKKQASWTRQQHEAGAADLTDVLLAQVEVGSTELMRLDQELKWQQADAALEAALQSDLNLPAASFSSKAP